MNEYDGDILNLLNSSTKVKDLHKKIRTFRGFGPKISALFIRAIVNLGFVTPDETMNEILPPVDVHDVRIALFTESVKLNGLKSENELKKYLRNYQKLVPITQKVWLYASRKINIMWVVLDQALWQLGSMGCANHLCSLCPIKIY